MGLASSLWGRVGTAQKTFQFLYFSVAPTLLSNSHRCVVDSVSLGLLGPILAIQPTCLCGYLVVPSSPLWAEAQQGIQLVKASVILGRSQILRAP